MPVLLLIENTTYEESTAALLAFYLLSIHLLLLFIRSEMRTSARSHASNADMLLFSRYKVYYMCVNHLSLACQYANIC